MGSTAYLVDGGMPLGAHNLVEAADATFQGDWVGAWFGESVAAGDLNGDGYADAIVGASSVFFSDSLFE